jgi:lipopolysaccharide transport system permease protein
VSAVSGSASGPGQVTVIQPTTGLIPPRLGELWRYRELLGFLVWRDIKVRYAQTLLGGVWTIFQPLAMMLVFTYAFGYLAKITFPGDVPYPLFALAGLTLWTFVSRGVYQGASSFIANIGLVTKTSSPRIIIPLAAVASMFLDFVISFALFLVFSLAYGVYPTWRFVFIPFILLVTFAFTFGISLFLSALNVRYRDVAQALPFLIQLWFFLSPVAYNLPIASQPWVTLIALNPMVGLIETFRWTVLGTDRPAGLLVAAVLVSAAWVLIGLAYFAKIERTFADDV